jgi:hypothetical protein
MGSLDSVAQSNVIDQSLWLHPLFSFSLVAINDLHYNPIGVTQTQQPFNHL